jgi:hypothetical protein
VQEGERAVQYPAFKSRQADTSAIEALAIFDTARNAHKAIALIMKPPINMFWQVLEIYDANIKYVFNVTFI